MILSSQESIAIKTLSSDMNIIKSGLIRLVNDEIELRNKKRFK